MGYVIVIKCLETDRVLKVGEATYETFEQADRAAERRMACNMNLDAYYAEAAPADEARKA